MSTIGARIRSLREYKGWSQEDLARESGLGRSHISLMENNERTPAADSLIKLVITLETSADFLLGLTDDPSPRPALNHPALADPRLRFIVDLWDTKVGKAGEEVDFVTDGLKASFYEIFREYHDERTARLKRDGIL